jgi:hypothetical protein
MDEALDWAAKAPSADRGSTEVRPVMLYEDTGAEDSQPATEARS